jgi:hypothetical protein
LPRGTIAALEPNRKFVANGAGGDARAAETNEGIRFSNVEITKSAERGNGAAGGWVGQDANEGAAAQLESRNSGEGLWQLHQGVGSLLHAGAAGGRDDHQGEASGGGEFGGAGDLLTHDRAHRATHKEEVHGDEGDLDATDEGGAADGGVALAGGGTGGGGSLGVPLGVGEDDRVERDQAGVGLSKGALVDQLRNALAGGHTEVMAACRADLEALLQGLLEEEL